MFIVFISINGVIHGIASITELLFFIVFYINTSMTTLKWPEWPPLYWPVCSVVFSVHKVWPSPDLRISSKMDTTLFEIILRLMMVVPDHLKAQNLCNKAVHMEPRLLAYAPDHLKTQKICKETVTHKPYMLRFIPDHLKTQEICDTAIYIKQSAFLLIPDHFKTQGMCIKAV